MRIAIILGILIMTVLSAHAEIKTERITYKQGDTELEGYLAYDTAKQGKLPGVLVAPDWMGPGKFSDGRAEELAKMGYVAFVVDIYGKSVRPANQQEAGAAAGKFKNDRPTVRARMQAALDILKARDNVDASKIAAIGYCFGGMCVLELARSGAPVAGVVTFHGSLDSPAPQDAKNINAKVLVLHGADDKFVNEQVAGFQDEMRGGNVDWQMIYYADSVHSFTNPAAGSDKSKGVAYNEKADRRSWEAMRTFFGEIFK